MTDRPIDAREERREPPAATAEDEAASPDADETLAFEERIKPLFREKGRASMAFVFDRRKEEDVIAHGPAVLGRLEAGTMPRDGAWAEEKTAVTRPPDEEPCR